jgi:hypothetical protein
MCRRNYLILLFSLFLLTQPSFASKGNLACKSYSIQYSASVDADPLLLVLKKSKLFNLVNKSSMCTITIKSVDFIKQKLFKQGDHDDYSLHTVSLVLNFTVSDRKNNYKKSFSSSMITPLSNNIYESIEASNFMPLYYDLVHKLANNYINNRYT